MNKRVWISWEWQRRSVVLSQKLGCKLYILEYGGLLRYIACIVETFLIYIKERPHILFVQNPSIILATLACLLRKWSQTLLIVDRHTNFLFSGPDKSRLFKRLFMLLSRFTIRNADLTLVTNKSIADIVRDRGGRPFILPDMLPRLASKEEKKLKGEKNILLISSFGRDEPIEEVFEAMRTLADNNCFLYVTGNEKKITGNLRSKKPKNTILTGFIPESEFIDMLFSVDAVMVLTTIDHCMLCGCYEAVAAQKPLITSDKKELREYFEDMVYVDNSPAGIASGINIVLNNIGKYRENVHKLKSKLTKSWEEKYRILEEELRSITR